MALTRAIALVVAAISDEGFLASCVEVEVRGNVALHLVDCFLRLLKGAILGDDFNADSHSTTEPVLPTSVTSHLNDGLLQRLLQVLRESQAAEATRLTSKSFEALMEVSLHSKTFWTLFSSHLQNSSLLKKLLVHEPRAAIRKSVAKQISNKCSFTPRWELHSLQSPAKLTCSLAVLLKYPRRSLWSHFGPW